MARRSAQETEITRQTILAAAERVFSQKGFHGANLREIGEQAGVPKSLLHHHFGSKRDLWDRVRQKQLELYASEMQIADTAQGSGQRYLRQSMSAYFRFLRNNPAYTRMLWWEFAETGFDRPRRVAPAEAVVDRVISGHVEQVRRLQAANELRGDIDPRMVVASIMDTLLMWLGQRQEYCGDPEERLRPALDDEYLQSLIGVFWEGLRPR